MPAPTKPRTGAGFGALHLPGDHMEKTLTTGRVTPHSIQLAIAEHGALRVFGAAAGDQGEGWFRLADHVHLLGAQNRVGQYRDLRRLHFENATGDVEVELLLAVPLGDRRGGAGADPQPA